MIQHALERLAIAAVALLLAGAAAQLVGRVAGTAGWLAALAAVLLSPLAADLVSGLAHWLADRVLSEEIPWLGPNFVRAFREHHEDPLGMLRYGFWETNGNTCISLLPLAASAFAAAALARPGDVAAAALAIFLISLVAWLALTNQVHKWAHAPQPPALARALQRRRLILSPAHHRRHHAAPFDSHFCITGGWLNRLLDRLRLFARLERALAGGWLPRRAS